MFKGFKKILGVVIASSVVFSGISAELIDQFKVAGIPAGADPNSPGRIIHLVNETGSAVSGAVVKTTVLGALRDDFNLSNGAEVSLYSYRAIDYDPSMLQRAISDLSLADLENLSVIDPKSKTAELASKEIVKREKNPKYAQKKEDAANKRNLDAELAGGVVGGTVGTAAAVGTVVGATGTGVGGVAAVGAAGAASLGGVVAAAVALATGVVVAPVVAGLYGANCFNQIILLYSGKEYLYKFDTPCQNLFIVLKVSGGKPYLEMRSVLGSLESIIKDQKLENTQSVVKKYSSKYNSDDKTSSKKRTASFTEHRSRDTERIERERQKEIRKAHRETLDADRANVEKMQKNIVDSINNQNKAKKVRDKIKKEDNADWVFYELFKKASFNLATGGHWDTFINLMKNKKVSVDLNRKTDGGWTLLTAASFRGHQGPTKGIVRNLIDNGADKNVTTSAGDTAFDLAKGEVVLKELRK